MNQPQPLIGEAIAVSKAVPFLQRFGLALAVIVAIIAGVLLMSEKINSANDRAVAAEKRTTEAQQAAATYKSEAADWKVAATKQSAAIEKLNVTFETQTRNMEAREREFSRKWTATTKTMEGLQKQQQALIDRPAVAPELEVPTARAGLKATKGYRLAN